MPLSQFVCHEDVLSVGRLSVHKETAWIAVPLRDHILRCLKDVKGASTGIKAWEGGAISLSVNKQGILKSTTLLETKSRNAQPLYTDTFSDTNLAKCTLISMPPVLSFKMVHA